MGEVVSTNNISISSYQSFDGSNYTLSGYERKINCDDLSIGIFGGVGTNFKGKTEGVVDLKCKQTYYDNDKVALNQNLRLRNKLDGNYTLQVRYSPLTVNVPVAKNTSVYVNPHYVAQINSNTREWKHSAGIFTGVTQKIGDFSVSVEVQRYNLQDIKDNSGKNWSGNIIVSYPF